MIQAVLLCDLTTVRLRSMSKTKVGQFNIEYFDVGEGERVVVLVHGWSYSAQVWHSVQNKLAERQVRSIAISLLGAGGSDRSEDEADYHPESYAKQIDGVVEALGLGQFVLMGHF